MPSDTEITIFSSPECDKCDLPVTCFCVQKRYFFIPWEPRIRYFLIVRDPVVSGIRYFFIPRDPVVPCVVVVPWWWWSSSIRRLQDSLFFYSP